MSIRERLLTNSTVDATATLAESILYTSRENFPTPIPALNLALSGSLDRGFTSGITMLAGPSKHFKSLLGLVMARGFLDKRQDGVILFYDTEFGMPASYFASLNIPPTAVVHTPITDIEQFKFDIMKQLSALKRGDPVLIILDSLGNIASKKEVDDALEAKSAADMTRAKQLKSVFRMITPHLLLKNIPMIVINHVYQEQNSMYPRQIVSSGTGPYYSSDTILIIGRHVEKDGSEVAGYHFILNVEKSRFVREKAKIPITVDYDRGISKYSGLFDLALQTGHIIKVSNGWYKVTFEESPQFRESTVANSPEFWAKLLTKTNFAEEVTKRYALASKELLNAN